ncbi:MAG: PspA/IM30 family protein [Treponema sp.]|nr:PspA/IM30 family protein [Treponema sp.]
MDDANLAGMNPADAREYILAFVSTLKLTEKQISDIDADIAKWQSRIELANSKSQPDLAQEAEKERALLVEKQSALKAEADQLRRQIDEMRAQIPMLASQERSIDTDLLEQELLMAAGYMPGDDEKARNERLFRELEKNHAAETALAELKNKMGH